MKESSSLKMDPEPLIEAYIQQLSPAEQKAYAIAKRNLGSSFNLALSIGFLDYKKNLPTPSLPVVEDTPQMKPS